MSKARCRLRILAIDPGTKEMGYALTEGEALVYHGVVHIPVHLPAFERYRRAIAATGALLNDLRPQHLVIERTHFNGSRRSEVLNTLVPVMAALARKRGIKVSLIAATTVKQHLTGYGWSDKSSVAAAAISRYPELRSYSLVATRHAQRVQANRFDAVALAVTARFYLSRNGK